ncbi:MAG TPA: hypothetical protein VJ734_08235 [Nitrosospira sp.]|nr:hypothetical protein [Nitrosospira sp.]
MKSSTSINRSLASILALASTAIFSMAGVAYAQYTDNTSGQGSSAGQSGYTGDTAKKPSGEGDPFAYDILQDPIDQGYVDQEKRIERANDPRSPSPETHVPNFPVDEQGRPLKDPKYEQGGPIGPN